jgi:hypothetical protein
MVSPKMPGSCSVRETVLDDQAHGCRDHTVGVAAPREGEVRQVGVEVLLAARAKMLREPDVEIHRSFRSGVAHVVEDSIHPSVSVRAVVAVRAEPVFVVTAAFDDLRVGKVRNARDPLCSIRSVLPGCGHLSSLQAKNFFSPEEIGSERPSA